MNDCTRSSRSMNREIAKNVQQNKTATTKKIKKYCVNINQKYITNNFKKIIFTQICTLQKVKSQNSTANLLQNRNNFLRVKNIVKNIY